MKNWKILSSKKVLTNKFFNVRKDKCITAQGRIIKEYYVKEGLGSAMVFAVTKDQKVIVEEQYRHGVQKVSLDLPCGRIKKGESAINAAKRELLEETGYRAKNLILLGKLSYNPASSEEYLYIYLAKELKYQANKRLERGEEIKLLFIPLRELENYIKDQKIFCVPCIAAIYLALKYLKNKKTPKNNSL